MKKILAAASCLALVASLGFATPAFADPAVVITADNACVGFVPTPTGGFGTFLIGSLHSVVTSSGNSQLVCKFDITAGQEPAKATRAEGFGCGTFLGFTTDTKMVASPGGQATLVCKVRTP